MADAGEDLLELQDILLLVGRDKFRSGVGDRVQKIRGFPKRPHELRNRGGVKLKISDIE